MYPVHDPVLPDCLMQLALVLAWALEPGDTSAGACAWSRGTTRGSLLFYFCIGSQCERLCSPCNMRVLTPRNAWTPGSESKSKGLEVMPES